MCQELSLLNSERQLLREGILRKRQGVDNVDYNLFLFDHMLLIAKKKKGKEISEYKIHKKPIPLEMIAFGNEKEEALPNRRTSSILSGNTRTTTQLMHASTYKGGGGQSKLQSDQNKGYQLSIIHLGRTGSTHVFYANTLAERKQWQEKIEAQRDAITDERKIFEIRTLTKNTFGSVNRVTCSAVLCMFLCLIYYSRFQDCVRGRRWCLYPAKPRFD